ncbi:MAG: transcription-repair coupling factor [Elusimicrobia bacterium]|nr:transcription-repair coupling factor [Elusimicrobiota bacterium]
MKVLGNDLFNNQPVFAAILEALQENRKPEVTGLSGVSKALFIRALGSQLNCPLLIVGEEEPSLKFYDDLLLFASAQELDIFLDEEYGYLRLLEAVRNKTNYFCVASREALIQPVIPFAQYQKLYFSLSAGQTRQLAKLAGTLVAAGYQRTPFVEKPGEFSVRGGIVDVFVPLAEHPARLEFTGDRLESLRQFESLTQRSIKILDRLSILPLTTGQEKSPLWSYFSEQTIVVKNELLAPQEPLPLCGSWSELSITLSRSPQTLSFDFQPMESFHSSIDRLKERLKQWRGQGYAVTLIADNAGQQQRLQELLSTDADFCHLMSGVISGGFISTVLKVAVISDEEIFGRYLERKYLAKIKKPRPVPLSPFTDLKEHDYVVHETYGIGIYEGIQRLVVGNKEEDFLSLKYAEGDRLYVPVEQMKLVQKYISAGAYPGIARLKMYRLGGNAWQRVKEQVKESTWQMAKELLGLHSERSIIEGQVFNTDTHWQQEFEAAFIYEETPDQRQAIQAVKGDMSGPKPMDRLVCGDVGYGKTEVAMRAAFIAVNNNKQAAILVPTTILAEQHLNTFRERFADYPLRIEMLSRFRSKAEHDQVIKDLAKGLVDVIVGTHRLLQKDIKFKDLGLLVVDEEQRFGVSHKERIKQICKNVHVLTLTATPIPRTLEMSLSGIRDVSLINNPPEGRLPVSTYVMEYNDEVLRQAIIHELSRQGQIFYVHNRVQTIDRCAKKLSALVPEARIRVAHGQMNSRELEKIMLDFMARKFDVIVATTIIESGLDMPNVNTLIVDDATRFGLADLYQLRGRVGRSNRRAYSYFFYPGNFVFTQDAAARLKAIQEFTQLGSGFKIAMRDLELRGAGNLLGKEQSGYISKVGFDLYCQLLQENIQRLKGQGKRITITPSINLRLKAYLPVPYISDELPRMEIYKKLSQVSALDELREVQGEIKDRYGPLPLEVLNLIEIIELRVLAQDLLIEEINEQEAHWEFLFHPQTRVEGASLVQLAGKLPGEVSFQAGPPFTLVVKKGQRTRLRNILQRL